MGKCQHCQEEADEIIYYRYRNKFGMNTINLCTSCYDSYIKTGFVLDIIEREDISWCMLSPLREVYVFIGKCVFKQIMTMLTIAIQKKNIEYLQYLIENVSVYSQYISKSKIDCMIASIHDSMKNVESITFVSDEIYNDYLSMEIDDMIENNGIDDDAYIEILFNPSFRPYLENMLINIFRTNEIHV